MGELPAARRRSLSESLEVLFMGPREWGPIFRIPSLWKVEMWLWFNYFFRFMPLDIILQGSQLDRPFTDFSYGDTPFFTGYQILKRANAGPNDRFFDLGSGRGKMVYLAHLAFHCEATGVELLPGYVRIARKVAYWSGCEEVSFLQKDFLAVDLSDASIVYVCAAALAEDTREDLLLHVHSLRPGTRWITAGWECEHAQLEFVHQEEHLFTWGREKVNFYRVLEPVLPALTRAEEEENFDEEFEDEARALHLESEESAT